jgi:hypothetical protein
MRIRLWFILDHIEHDLIYYVASTSDDIEIKKLDIKGQHNMKEVTEKK